MKRRKYPDVFPEAGGFTLVLCIGLVWAAHFMGVL